MTVRQAIKEHRDNFVKVGFGNSFVYCDTPNDDTEVEILAQEEYAIGCLEHRIKDLKKQLYDIENTFGYSGYVFRRMEDWEARHADETENEDKKARRELYKERQEERAKTFPADKIKRIGVQHFLDRHLWRWNTEHEKEIENEKKAKRRQAYIDGKYQFYLGLPDRIAEAEEWLATFTPLIDREVTEIYPSIYGGTIILAKKHGYKINGRFWDCEEYQLFKETGRTIFG